MGSFSFVHVTTEKTKQARVDRHNRGVDRPASALTRAAWDHRAVIPVMDNEFRAAQTRAECAAGPKRRGRPGSQTVRAIFGHPPAHEAPDAWPPSKVEAWARESAVWLSLFVGKASGGKAQVVRADLHVDETRPHVHASVLPAMPREDGSGLTLSWERLHMKGTGSTSARESMRRIQTMYHEAIGSRYGMVRGVPSMVSGVGKGETEVDRLKGLRTRAALAEAELERLRKAGRRERQGAAAMQLEVDGARARETVARRKDRTAKRTQGRMSR